MRLTAPKVLSGISLLAAAVLRAVLAAANLPSHFQSDEFQIVERALAVGTGQLNPGLFTWPGSLVIYLNFLLFAVYFVAARVTGAISDAAAFADLYWSGGGYFYHLSRGLSVTFGVATVAFTALWARWVVGKESSGWVAAAAAAVAPGAITVSALGLPDAAATAFGAASLAACSRYRVEPRTRWAFIAGAALGLGVACKYHILLYAPAALGYFLLARGRRGRVKAVIVGAAACAAAFAAACPFALLDFGRFARDITAMANRPHFVTWSPALAFCGRTTLPLSVGYVLGGAAVAGAGVALWRRNAGAAMAVVAALPFIVAALARPLPPRHVLPLVPAAAVLAGYLPPGLAGNGRLKKYLAAVVASAVGAVPLIFAIEHILWASRQDTRVEAAAYVAAHVPEGSPLLIEFLEPEVEGPNVKPTRASLLRLMGEYRKRGGGSPGRMALLAKNPRYPFGAPCYDCYLVALTPDWGAVPRPAYALAVEPDDALYFGEQAKPYGAELTTWGPAYRRYLQRTATLRWRCDGADRPGPTITLYYLAP